MSWRVGVVAALMVGATAQAQTESAGGGLSTLTVDAPITGAGTVVSPLDCQDASGAQGGCITTGTQTLAGSKTFSGILTAGALLQLIDGTGAAPSVCFGDTATCIYRGGITAEDISFLMGGGTRWAFRSDHIDPAANNANDLGNSLRRMRTVYVATGVDIGTANTTAISHSGKSSGALDFPSIAAGDCEELTQTLTGAAANDPLACGYPVALEANLTPSCRVSASNTITYRVCNEELTGSIDPASGTYTARIIR